MPRWRNPLNLLELLPCGLAPSNSGDTKMSGEKQFQTGDIFFSETGWKGDDGGGSTHFKLFEYRADGEPGQGFQYSRGGKMYPHFWAWPKEENRFINIPEDVLFSFKHGTSSFYVDDKIVPECETIHELISASDFKFVSQCSADLAAIIEGIDTIEKVKENWLLIKTRGTSILIAQICLAEVGIRVPQVYNGEIGVHSLTLLQAFVDNLPHIEEALGLDGS